MIDPKKYILLPRREVVRKLCRRLRKQYFGPMDATWCCVGTKSGIVCIKIQPSWLVIYWSKRKKWGCRGFKMTSEGCFRINNQNATPVALEDWLLAVDKKIQNAYRLY